MATVLDEPCIGNHGNHIYGSAAALKRLYDKDVISISEHEEERKAYFALIEKLGYASYSDQG